MKYNKNKNFKQISFSGGIYGEFGFYYLPDGSFLDPDGIYFNPNGFDSHWGYYSNNFEYIPGPGWINEFLCYEDELKNFYLNKKYKSRKNLSNILPLLPVLNEEENDYENENENENDDQDLDKIFDLKINTKDIYNDNNNNNDIDINNLDISNDKEINKENKSNLIKVEKKIDMDNLFL
jgi:hypothetical protein